MNTFKPVFTAIALAIVSASVAPSVHADSLLMQRVQQEKGMSLPKKGMSMAEVERQFGAPTAVCADVGTSVELRVQVHDGVLQIIVPHEKLTASSADIFIVWMVGNRARRR